MKKIIFGCIALLTTATAYGASVDALANQSASYLGNPAQNASLSADGVFYNPAGTAFLEDGHYITGGLQIADTTYEMETGGKNYKANDPFGVVPNFGYIHKSGNWSQFATFSGAAGGPTLEYEDGVPLLTKLTSGSDNGTIEGKNAYYMATLGTGYKLNEEWSVAGGVRLVNAHRNIKVETKKGTKTIIPKIGVVPADGTYDSERTANGVGGTFGIDYKPNDRLNMALTYNTKVKLEFEADADGSGNLGGLFDKGVFNGSDLDPIVDGRKQWRDLPAELKYGVSYKLTDEWTVMGGANYYFLSGADTDGKPGFNDGWEVNAGTEYQVSEKWTLTTGYNYADTGATEETFNDTEFALNSHIFAVGAKFQQTPSIEWTFSTMYVHYVDETYSNVKYSKNIVAVGAGITYKF